MTSAPTGECCPACSSRHVRTLLQGSDRLYGTTDVLFSVVECAKCKLIRLYPWPSPAELPRYYPADYWFQTDQAAAARLEEFYRRTVLRDHVRFVRRALGPPSDAGLVLDVGCGGGLFPRMLREEGYRCIGMDFATQAAGVAWRRNGVPVAAGLLPDAPLAPDSLGALSMFHVLEHLYDPAEYLEAAHRLLRPGGKLIVQVPNADCWQFALFKGHWNGIDVPRHLINFKAKDLRLLLEACGFEVKRQKHFSLRDNPAGLASTIAPGLDPMARRIRKSFEGERERLGKDLLYFAIVAAAIPFTLLEAAFRAGSSVMMEARKV